MFFIFFFFVEGASAISSMLCEKTFFFFFLLLLKKYACELKSSGLVLLVYLEWAYIERYPQWCLFFKIIQVAGRWVNCFTIHLKVARTGRGGTIVIPVLHNGSCCFLVVHRTFQRAAASIWHFSRHWPVQSDAKPIETLNHFHSSLPVKHQVTTTQIG